MHQVPLVDDDSDRLAVLDRLAGDRLVLLRHAVQGVEDEEHDVRALHGVERPQARKVLHGRRQLCGRLDARRVNQPERVELPVPALEIEGELDRVAGRSRALVHDKAIALEEPVGERRLPHVWAPYETDADGPAFPHARRPGSGVLLGRIRPAPYPLEDRLAERRLASSVLRGNEERLAQAQARDPLKVRLLFPKVSLVHDEDHRLAPEPEAGGDPVVEGRDALKPVDCEKDERCGVDGEADLLFGRLDDRGRGGLPLLQAEPAGVHERVAVLDLGGDHVARHPGLVVHDGDPPAREPVEEPALADVGPAYDDDGAEHGVAAFTNRSIRSQASTS